MKLGKGTAWLAVVLVVCALAGYLWRPTTRASSDAGVWVLPDVYEFPEALLEYGHYETVVQLANRSHERITSCTARLDCSCITATDRDGRDLAHGQPIDLAPGDVLPVTIGVQVKGTYGSEKHRVELRCTTVSGGELAGTLEVRFNTLGAIYPVPNPVTAFQVQPGTVIDVSVPIFSAFPANDITVTKLDSRNPDWLHASLRPVKDVAIPEGDPLNSRGFRAIGAVALQIRAPEVAGRDFAGYVSIATNRDKVPPARIYVVGSTCASAILARPEQVLVVFGANESRAQRTVRVRCPPQVTPQVAASPPFATTTLARAAGDWWLAQLELDISAGKTDFAQGTVQLLLGTEMLEIPIRVIRDSATSVKSSN